MQTKYQVMANIGRKRTTTTVIKDKTGKIVQQTNEKGQMVDQIVNTKITIQA